MGNGNAPKEAVMARVRETYSHIHFGKGDDDIADAIGLGLYYMGK